MHLVNNDRLDGILRKLRKREKINNKTIEYIFNALAFLLWAYFRMNYVIWKPIDEFRQERKS